MKPTRQALEKRLEDLERKRHSAPGVCSHLPYLVKELLDDGTEKRWGDWQPRACPCGGERVTVCIRWTSPQDGPQDGL